MTGGPGFTQVEQLFHTNQVLVATCFGQARVVLSSDLEAEVRFGRRAPEKSELDLEFGRGPLVRAGGRGPFRPKGAWKPRDRPRVRPGPARPSWRSRSV